MPNPKPETVARKLGGMEYGEKGWKAERSLKLCCIVRKEKQLVDEEHGSPTDSDSIIAGYKEKLCCGVRKENRSQAPVTCGEQN